MNIKKMIPLGTMLAMVVVSGCASHINANNVEYYNPVQGVHGVDRSKESSHDSLGIYSKRIQTNCVTTTNADGSWYTDYSSHYDRGFHMPFGGNNNDSHSSSEFSIPAVPDCPGCGQQAAYGNQPMMPPPDPRPQVAPPALLPPVAPSPRNVYTLSYQYQPVLYGIPRVYYCLPQQRIRYYPLHSWWKPCRR
jgi:hypothetical protein